MTFQDIQPSHTKHGRPLSHNTQTIMVIMDIPIFPTLSIKDSKKEDHRAPSLILLRSSFSAQALVLRKAVGSHGVARRVVPRQAARTGEHQVSHTSVRSPGRTRPGRGLRLVPRGGFHTDVADSQPLVFKPGNEHLMRIQAASSGLYMSWYVFVCGLIL